jgi:hypothetical protein
MIIGIGIGITYPMAPVVAPGGGDLPSDGQGFVIVDDSEFILVDDDGFILVS